MKKLAAALLALAALSANAQSFDRVVVESADQCPSGTAATVPSYHWKEGHFVRDGVLCESIYKRSPAT